MRTYKKSLWREIIENGVSKEMLLAHNMGVDRSREKRRRWRKGKRRK